MLAHDAEGSAPLIKDVKDRAKLPGSSQRVLTNGWLPSESRRPGRMQPRPAVAVM
jgi:hypothetical protein